MCQVSLVVKYMSPVVFALFLNGFKKFMNARSCSGIRLEFVMRYFYFYLKFLALLYADDIVIFGTDETSCQKNLDTFYEYVKM